MAAAQQWATIDGYAVGHAMKDIRTLPLERFCNFIWYLVTKNANEQEQTKARAQLWRPPPVPAGTVAPPIPKQSPWSAESETSAFAALKAGLTGQVSSPAGTTTP